MRASIVTAALVCLLAVGSAIAQAHYSTSETAIGTLLDDPAAREVIDKHVPGFSSKPQIDMARSMTLKAIQQYDPTTYTDEVLAKIDADLAKLPEKK